MASVSPKYLSVSVGFVLGCACGLPSTAAQDLLDEPVETLETIEVPATVVIQEERDIAIPTPEPTYLLPLPFNGFIPASIPTTRPGSQAPPKVVRDSTADRKGIRKNVRPAKAERPPYPHIAKEQGWEGTVVLRINVNRKGTVEKLKVQKSSGFPSLDQSAVQAVKTWRFEPAKDGEFSIPKTVDLPIRFDLSEE